MKVTVYSKPNCSNCDKTKKWLKEHYAEYDEVDLSEKDNREARAYYRSLGIDTLPVVVGTDNKGRETIISGYDKDALKTLNITVYWAPEDEERVKDRLRELGYMD